MSYYCYAAIITRYGERVQAIRDSITGYLYVSFDSAAPVLVVSASVNSPLDLEYHDDDALSVVYQTVTPYLTHRQISYQGGVTGSWIEVNYPPVGTVTGGGMLCSNRYGQRYLFHADGSAHLSLLLEEEGWSTEHEVTTESYQFRPEMLFPDTGEIIVRYRVAGAETIKERISYQDGDTGTWADGSSREPGVAEQHHSTVTDRYGETFISYQYQNYPTTVQSSWLRRSEDNYATPILVASFGVFPNWTEYAPIAKTEADMLMVWRERKGDDQPLVYSCLDGDAGSWTGWPP